MKRGQEQENADGLERGSGQAKKSKGSIKESKDSAKRSALATSTSKPSKQLKISSFLCSLFQSSSKRSMDDAAEALSQDRPNKQAQTTVSPEPGPSSALRDDDADVVTPDVSSDTKTEPTERQIKEVGLLSQSKANRPSLISSSPPSSFSSSFESHLGASD